MIYYGDEQLREIGEPWRELVDRIQETVQIMDRGGVVQPLKPYLRYGNPDNRIIAMPAYVGGTVAAAGLKWIASFPGNINAGLPRAHSVTILNETSTGEPRAIVNSSRVSAVRTAAVSGLMLREWLRHRLLDNRRDEAEEGLRIGIIGLGPIGRKHLAMTLALFGEHIDQVMLYDVRGISPEEVMPHSFGKRTGAGPTLKFGDPAEQSKPLRIRQLRKDIPIRFAGCWQELYRSCNVILTCTVSPVRYIDIPPAPGSLLLDISLRDYGLDAIRGIRSIVVDDWAEVCRENTDIELLHRETGLTAEDVMSLGDIVCRDAFSSLRSEEPVLFCPMGMAAFDVAIADWYVRKGEELGIGVRL
ncbi:2,3-diaminopropionate biosynthesis protein SbnB [Paenibacillus sp. PAMC21692]|uniref:2,3-diaminopropionate biosynthesis protein SbnB n=1 Tax=Paenibacillus sp. PAMC21692 TaxID=2762320 RepID=UPI00164D05D1|nr:2,3-diaminopropionate biosynthesis protein SbnB [Paenibacillus sp. PAMC21692]QNK57157.1 2,3-diaminopropionate biosynthesis protein SbnB [Paenibacillus sp. PAMC21692]